MEILESWWAGADGAGGLLATSKMNYFIQSLKMCAIWNGQ